MQLGFLGGGSLPPQRAPARYSFPHEAVSSAVPTQTPRSIHKQPCYSLPARDLWAARCRSVGGCLGQGEVKH